MTLQWTDTQKTLLIPLAGRAVAHRANPELGFTDPISEDVASHLPFAIDGFVADKKSVWGTIKRTQLFDSLVEEFVAAHPDGHVVCLGAGLCTRAWRLATPPARWTEIDFPEVIAVKRELFPAPPDFVSLRAGSITDPDLIDEVIPHDVPVLVVAEGVLMFVEREDADAVLQQIAAKARPGSAVVFDYIHPWICRISSWHPSLKLTGAHYRWGTRGGVQVEDLPGAELVSDRLFSGAYGFAARNLERVIAALARGPLYNVAHVRLGGHP